MSWGRVLPAKGTAQAKALRREHAWNCSMTIKQTSVAGAEKGGERHKVRSEVCVCVCVSMGVCAHV